MKTLRIPALILTVAMLAILLVSCGSNAAYKDGTYRAEAAEFHNGWKDTVAVTVSGGKISAVNWSGVNEDPAITQDKKTYAAEGNYGMEAVASQGEWDVQAEAAEDFVVQNNGTDKIKLITSGDKAGKSDSISGCTMTVSEFVELVNKALSDAAK